MERERIREKEVVRYVPRCTMLEDARKAKRLLLTRPYTGQHIAESFAQAGTFEAPASDRHLDTTLRWIGKVDEYHVGYKISPACEVSSMVEVTASVAVYVKNPPGYEPQWVYSYNNGPKYQLRRLVADEEYKEVMLTAFGYGIPNTRGDVDWNQATNWSNPEEYGTFRKILHSFGQLLCDR